MRLTEDTACGKTIDESENCTEESVAETNKEPKEEELLSVNGVKLDKAELNEKAAVESEITENVNELSVEIDENALSNGLVHDTVADGMEHSEKMEIRTTETKTEESEIRQHDVTSTIMDEEDAAVDSSENKTKTAKSEIFSISKTVPEVTEIEMKNSTGSGEANVRDEPWNPVKKSEQNEASSATAELEKLSMNAKADMNKTELPDDKAVLQEMSAKTVDTGETETITSKIEKKEEEESRLSIADADQSAEKPVVSEVF